MSSKELSYNLHDADLLWIEGVTNAYCDWCYVKQNAFNIIKKTMYGGFKDTKSMTTY